MTKVLPVMSKIIHFSVLALFAFIHSSSSRTHLNILRQKSFTSQGDAQVYPTKTICITSRNPKVVLRSNLGIIYFERLTFLAGKLSLQSRWETQQQE